MTTDILQTALCYSQKGILVDTNLFLLFLIGSADRQLIQSFKRTRQFTPGDYDLLLQFLDHFTTRVTTPNVITEVSNLAGTLTGLHRQKVFTALAQLVDLLDEAYFPSKDVTKQPDFVRFGVTDACVLTTAVGRYLLLTDDLPLALRCSERGGDYINFNHLRSRTWT